jgi:hypothetical protein
MKWMQNFIFLSKCYSYINFANKIKTSKPINKKITKLDFVIASWNKSFKKF